MIFTLYLVFTFFSSSQNWYAKTPLGKKRIKAALGKEGDEEPPKTGGKGGKKKGKK